MDHPTVYHTDLVLGALDAILRQTPTAGCQVCGNLWQCHDIGEVSCPNCGALGKEQIDITKETIESISRNFGVDMEELEEHLEIQRV